MCPPLIETAIYKAEVKEFRKKCQSVKPEDLVFFDQTSIKLESKPTYGLARRGHTAKESGKTREVWEPRVDFVGAVNWDGPIAPAATTPKDRKVDEVSGYTKTLMLDWITESLSGPISEMNSKEVVVCMDKGLSLTEEEVKEELIDGGADNVKHVWIMPTNGGKILNPLDNCLWPEWKKKVREREPKTPDELAQIMTEEFNAVPPDHVRAYYRKCSLLAGDPLDRDLE